MYAFSITYVNKYVYHVLSQQIRCWVVIDFKANEYTVTVDSLLHVHKYLVLLLCIELEEYKIANTCHNFCYNSYNI